MGVLLLLPGLPLNAQRRDPVLNQIDLPHPYYYREMYLPQLTTGPSSAAWLPDSRSLIYSMAGSLWKQSLDTTMVEQLTDGPGYDYQPDCSADGRWVAYVSYQKDAMELWAMDLATKQSRQLTSGGAVNLEPRFSPDGKRIAFVSTSYKGHFHIFLGKFEDGILSDVQRLTGETSTALPRFYYSQVDHEISPAWSPDGSELVFVSNRGRIYGTGGFWRMNAVPGAEAREVHHEETAWKAHPEFSPDGKRLVYSSYIGQAWHQLWVMPAAGGDAFPLSYGDFDNIDPRWSPDGKRIAFISNRGGNTSLWTQDAQGGSQQQIVARQKRYMKPMRHLSITVLGPDGNPIPARLFVTGADGRSYAPDDAWMQADDSIIQSEGPFEAHYFESNGQVEITVPAGEVRVVAMRGFEYKVAKETVLAGSQKELVIRLQPLGIPDEHGGNWVSGDLHVHMNYGGTYRNTPEHLIAQAASENLAMVENLIVNKEQRIPDIAYFTTKVDAGSTPGQLLFHAQEFHTSYWGHLGLLHLTRNFLLPDYASYSNTAAASLFPDNATVADVAHEQHALVGYVHPLDFVPDPANDPSLTHNQPLDEALELPVDVALGKVDYIEVVGFSDHLSTASVWYRLLNCGFHLPAGSGSDAMANFASLRGPLGLNRVYARLPKGALDHSQWLDSLKRGRTFATNGPLLGFRLGDHGLGDDLLLPAGTNTVKFTAWLRSIVPVDHLQVICNGAMVRDLELSGNYTSADVKGDIQISHSGWCLLRASSENAQFPILDIYPYATTSPIYVTVQGSALPREQDAAYFVTWIDRLIEYAQRNKDWNTEAEKASVLDHLKEARAVYAQMQGQR
jgi:Tol biopolymer transport system component